MTSTYYQIVDSDGNGNTSFAGDYSPVEVTPGSDAFEIEREIFAMQVSR